MLIIFFDSPGEVHKEFVPEGKTVNSEFYNGVMDRLLKRIQRVRQAAFCCRDFSCSTIMRPPTKLQVFANFWRKKNVTTLYHHHHHHHPPYSPELSPPDYFLFPKLKMKLKGLHFADVAEIQEAVTNELTKFQNRNFRQLFRKCTTA